MCHQPFKNPRKNSSTFGMQLDIYILTQRTIRVICSSWLASGVQSKITEKYLASLTIFKITETFCELILYLAMN